MPDCTFACLPASARFLTAFHPAIAPCLAVVVFDGQLSRDGRYLAYVKPDSSNIANVFVRKLPSRRRDMALERSAKDLSIFDRDGTKTDRQVTFEKVEGVSAYSWSEDSTGILFIQDHDGDENYHLYLASIATPGDAIDLTPYPGVKAQDILSSELYPTKLFIVSFRSNTSGRHVSAVTCQL
jgi:hypothetical protein